MGNHINVGFNKFPKQGDLLGKEVDVCFNYNTSKVMRGCIVRDDIEEPFLTIIEGNNGKFYMSTECQYHPL